MEPNKLFSFIIERMNGAKYGAPEFYWWVKENLPKKEAEPILKGIDSGDNWEVQKAIYDYINHRDIYPLILRYVSAVSWLDDDPDEAILMSVSFFAPLRNVYSDIDEMTEVYYKYWAPARATTRRQVQQGFEMALRAGLQIWRGCSIEYQEGSSSLGADFIDIFPRLEECDRLKNAFKDWEAKNKSVVWKDWQPLTVTAEYQIGYYDVRKSENKILNRKMKYAVKQYPIYTKGRKHYDIEMKGDDYDE